MKAFCFLILYIFIGASLVAQLVKNLPARRETWVQSLGWEDHLEEGKATHSSILAWRVPWTNYTVHGVTKSRTRPSDFHFSFHALEKEMATHSSVLAWRIPGSGEPGGLPSMGSHRVGYDRSDLATAAAELNRASLVAQMVKNLPARRETWIRSLTQEDPLEKAMATHSSVLAWRIPGMGEPGGLLSMGSQKVGHD